MKQPKLNLTTKNKIDDLQALGLKPSHILVELRSLGLELPTTRQLTNHLAYNRKRNNGSVKPMTLQDVKDWCEQRTSIPEDMDQVFVTKFECITKPDRAFRLFLTTPRLLQLTQHSIGHLLVHATYKLVQEDYPVLTIGTTDRDKRFHPLDLSVSMNEQQIDLGRCIIRHTI